jgi:hypothetical protein
MMRRTVSVATATVVIVLALVASASAGEVPLGAGEAKVVFAAGFEKTLRSEGVTIKPLGPAALKGHKLTLPIASGSFEPTAEQASIALAGGFKLRAGRKTAAVRALKFDASSGNLSAVVAGRRLRLARLAGVKLKPEGVEAHLEAGRLRLTGAAAGALGRALETPGLFRAARSLGSLDARARPSEVEASGWFAIGTPETVFSRLQSLEVGLGLWGGSEGWNGGAEPYFLFPTGTSRVAADASSGVLEGEPNAGVTMQMSEPPPRNMLLRHPRIDLATRELSATLSPLSTEGALTGTIATLDFSGAKINFRASVGALELTGVRAISNQFIADQLNTRFDIPGTFQAGETLAQITVHLRS